MSIEIIDKLKQKNNGIFKLVDLDDVDYDGTGKSAKEVLDKCIQKEPNKGLSTNDYTTPEKDKLASLENYDDTSIKNDIQVQKTRIDTFTSLKEGSTTGDAELIDARVGYGGATFSNVGSAIREQVSPIIDSTLVWTEIDATNVQTGLVELNNKSVYSLEESCYIKVVIPRIARKIKVSGKSANATYNYSLGAFYDSNDSIIEKFGNETETTYVDLELDVPSNAVYVLVNQKDTKSSDYKKIKIFYTAQKIGEKVEKISEIENSIDEIALKMSNISRKTIDMSIIGFVAANGADSDAYNISNDVNGRRSDYIKTQGYTHIKAKLFGSKNWIWNIAFFNKNKEFLPDISFKNQLIDYDIEIPTSAYYVIVSSWSDAESNIPSAYLYNKNSIENRVDIIEDRFKDASGLLDNIEFSVFAKWGVIGDSLSVGHTTDADGNAHGRNIYYSWGQFLARKIGNTCLNFGRSGIDSKGWMSDGNCYPKLINPDNLCQCYIIALGANDAANVADVPIGTISDIDFNNMDNNADTVYGWYAKVINAVKTTAPKAPIFLFTIPYPRNTTSEVVAINNMIRELVTNNNFSNLYLVDLDANYNDYFKSGKMYNMIGNTGWHLTALGYLYESRVIEMALSKVIYDNYEDFQNVPFIPYGNAEKID